MNMPSLAIILASLGVTAASAVAATYTVSTTEDNGPGSLRQAIIDANAQPNSPATQPDEITFNIPGVNVHTIGLLSPLPPITDAVMIDGYTQPGTNPNALGVGNDASLRIELNGANLSGAGAVGLDIRASRCTVRGLVINRFAADGIRLSDFLEGTRISGCFIGTNAAGTAALPNSTGIRVRGSRTVAIGGTSPAERNVIAGNATGVFSEGGGGHLVHGNYLGTDRTGSTPLPNEIGIHLHGTSETLIGGTVAGARNVVLSTGPSVLIRGAGTLADRRYIGSANTVQGNYVGLTVEGTAPAEPSYGSIQLENGTFDNLIGGADAAARNVIAHRVAIDEANANVVRGNYIGTDATGMVANDRAAGINIARKLFGRSAGADRNTVDGNVICSTGFTGVGLTGAVATTIQRNFIGVAADGSTPIGSMLYGIYVSGTDQQPAGGTIGGTSAGSGNIIANAASDGVAIVPNALFDATGGHLSILGNSIYRNGRLGINLAVERDSASQVTPNDPGDGDTGPNDLQNYPVLSSASFSNGQVRITGSLNSKPGTAFRIELFGNSEPDASGFGEGRYYLGFTEVMTDAGGNAKFDVTLPHPNDVRSVSSTATDPLGRTSEFFSSFFGQLQNIATRARVQTGDNVLIGGLIVTGTEPKRVIIRAIGPSLEISGVPFQGRLEDPVLELRDQNQLLLATNDNWKDTQRAEIEATGIPPRHDLESAIVRTLEPGAYTAVMSGNGATSGVGVVEVYDLASDSASRLANISTRGVVETGENVMIGGFIIGPDGRGARVLLRAIGPSLTASGVPNALQDPTIELRDSTGALLATNDNWRENQAEVQATGAAPRDDRESALIAALSAGNYTAVVKGKNNSVGVALVEVYHVN